MNDSSVPVIVVTAARDDVECINQTLRDAGHPTHCRWVHTLDELSEELESGDAQLIIFFADDFPSRIKEVARVRQNAAAMVPLVVVRNIADEKAITDAMLEGAQDLVSMAQRPRVTAVAEREMRSFRLERALNDTLASATQYKRQLKAFMAGSVDAIAYSQEGIVVEVNQAWSELFNQPDDHSALGPLMDYFDTSSQAALKGALIACSKNKWDGEPLKVIAVTADGSSVSVKLHLENAVFDGDPAIKLSVPRELEARKEPEELVDRAIHADPTTGFYHRQRFVELLTDRLDERSQSGASALVYIRPDKFSEIEDEVGPLASEEILVQLAELLRGMVHEQELCGRFGGTIFTLVLKRGALRDIEVWAEHAVSRISSHIFEVAANTLSITCTIGLAELGPGTDRVEELISNAERANQRGRQRGGNEVVLEETADESTRIKRFDTLWVHQIRSALVENRFRLVHLGIASLGGDVSQVYDTVLRMIDQQGDEVSAAEFMAAARRNKLLRPIDRWVIGATMQFCVQQDFNLAFVKLSSESVIDTSLVDWIRKLAGAKQVDPGRICFQVSEEDATQYLKQTNALSEKLRAGGFGFAIEHFGIGRDPMRVLNQTPMNFVKIDGSLMQTVATDIIVQEKVRGFVNAAAKRKIKTIAERVEDANTMAVLFQLGVSYMQGHYLHEPEVILQGHS